MHTLIPAYLDFEPRLLCHYRNATVSKQVLRIRNIDQWYFERVVDAGEELLFEAPQTAELEVWSSDSQDLRIKRLPCQSLLLQQWSDPHN